MEQYINFPSQVVGDLPNRFEKINEMMPKDFKVCSLLIFANQVFPRRPWIGGCDSPDLYLFTQYTPQFIGKELEEGAFILGLSEAEEV
jgi:hypothetical protein